MSNAAHDRQQTRQGLQELAKLAKAGSSSFATADSSGYVDLTAFSATDDRWVDRELERARKGLPPPPSRASTTRVLAPESMAPVALSAFLDPPAQASSLSRTRRAALVAAAMASVIVGVLAIVVTRRAPSSESKAAAVAVVETAPPVPTTAASPIDEPTSPAASPAPTDTAPAVHKAPVYRAPGSRSTKAGAPSHAIAAAPHPAARPAAIPRSKSAPSSEGSLMDMMRASVKGK